MARPRARRTSRATRSSSSARSTHAALLAANWLWNCAAAISRCRPKSCASTTSTASTARSGAVVWHRVLARLHRARGQGFGARAPRPRRAEHRCLFRHREVLRHSKRIAVFRVFPIKRISEFGVLGVRRPVASHAHIAWLACRFWNGFGRSKAYVERASSRFALHPHPALGRIA